MTDATMEDDVPDDEDLTAIAAEVWASLGLDLVPGVREPDQRSVTASAVVDITGRWQGRLGLECAGDLPQRLASVMYATHPDDLSSQDVSDAVGELANILAGNAKSLLPEPSRLSVPVVTLGPPAPGSEDGSLLRSVPMRSFGIAMRVTLRSTGRS